MNSSIDINGKKLLPIKEVVSLVDYSKDYITRLARERKVVATQIGRKWYVDVDSLKNYYESSQAEQEIKKRQLSDQRKKDLAIKTLKEEKRALAKKRARRRSPALVSMFLIAALGLGVGVFLEPYAEEGAVNLNQLASVNTGTDVIDVTKVKERLDSSVSQELIPEFSSTASHRKITAEQGLLLMPLTTRTQVEADEYFSDPVTVVVDEDGNTSVVRVDETGQPMGEAIPFLIVPINSDSPWDAF